MNVDADDDWVLLACGSGTGSGGPWEIVLACIRLDDLLLAAGGIHTYLLMNADDWVLHACGSGYWVWWPMGKSLGMHAA